MILNLQNTEEFMAVLEALSQYVDNNEECEESQPYQQAAQSLLDKMETALANG